MGSFFLLRLVFFSKIKTATVTSLQRTLPLVVAAVVVDVVAALVVELLLRLVVVFPIVKNLMIKMMDPCVNCVNALAIQFIIAGIDSTRSLCLQVQELAVLDHQVLKSLSPLLLPPMVLIQIGILTQAQQIILPMI